MEILGCLSRTICIYCRKVVFPSPPPLNTYDRNVLIQLYIFGVPNFCNIYIQESKFQLAWLDFYISIFAIFI